jgi:hypothetical protein
VAGAAEAEAVVVRPTEVVEAPAVVAAQRAAAEVAARQPTAAPMKLAAAEVAAAPAEETVVQLPIPAGPFAESTFSPSYSPSTIQQDDSNKIGTATPGSVTRQSCTGIGGLQRSRVPG